jgi:hypothetical protein
MLYHNVFLLKFMLFLLQEVRWRRGLRLAAPPVIAGELRPPRKGNPRPPRY